MTNFDAKKHKCLRKLCSQFDVNTSRYCGEMACVEENLTYTLTSRYHRHMHECKSHPQFGTKHDTTIFFPPTKVTHFISADDLTLWRLQIRKLSFLSFLLRRHKPNFSSSSPIDWSGTLVAQLKERAHQTRLRIPLVPIQFGNQTAKILLQVLSRALLSQQV